MRNNHWLGRSGYENDAFFHGQIGLLRMWHGRALGGGEVAELYTEVN
jgi:hypothetical protein